MKGEWCVTVIMIMRMIVIGIWCVGGEERESASLIMSCVKRKLFLNEVKKQKERWREQERAKKRKRECVCSPAWYMCLCVCVCACLLILCCLLLVVM